MNLGKVIYERVKDLPAFKSFPQKKIPGSFAVCPNMMADLRQAGGDHEFRHTVSVFCTTRQAVSDAINYMVRVGKEEIKTGSWCLWLHAVKLSGTLRMPKERLFTGTVTYIFRARKLDYVRRPKPKPGSELAPKAKPKSVPKAELVPKTEPVAEAEPESEVKPVSKAPEKKKSKKEVK